MGFYSSEKEAAYFALRELKRFLPETPDNKGTEWGSIIYRYNDPEGGYRYSFQIPTTGMSAEWQPTGKTPAGAIECAYCHTHPNDKPFSKVDIDTALGKRFPYPKTRMYMVTQSGAYWYDGKLDEKLWSRSSSARYGTMWGLQYSALIKK